MARVFIDGLESGGLGLWSSTSGATAATGISGMTGTYCLEIAGVNDYAIKDVDSTSTIFIHCNAKTTASPANSSNIAVFYNSSTIIGALLRDSSSTELKAYRGNSYTGTLLGSGGTMASGIVKNIQIKYVPHSSSGIFQVKLDGILVIDYSGNTNSTYTTLNKVRHGYDGVGYYGYLYMDDFVYDNSSWVGNSIITALTPNGIDTTNWTASSGTNYTCVDEIPESTSDFVYINSNDTIDLYQATDISADAETIKAVQVQAYAKSSGAATPTNLQLGVKSGVTSGYSSSKALPTSPASLAGIWETNPATSNPWTPSEVNGMYIGMQSKA